MRIMAERDSNMEKDIMVANALIDDIKCALADIKKVVDFKKNSAGRIVELEEKKELAQEKLNSIQNSRNCLRLYKYELKDKLSRLGFLDIKARIALAKKFKQINECRHNLKDMRSRTEAEIADCDRLIERRKSIRVHENLSAFTTTLVTSLCSAISEYRSFRKDFYELHGLMLPSINLSDLVKRTNGNELDITDFDFPKFTFIPFVDEEQLIDTYSSADELEFEIYEA